MKVLKKYLLCLFSSTSLIICAPAQSTSTPFKSGRDDASSNVSISNKTGKPINVYGLYISSHDINDCSSCFGGIIGGDNVAGAVASPIHFNPNQTLPIGQNYLYNMIYNGIFFVKNNGAMPCSLPGCSWPGDDPNVHGWCVSINAASLDSDYTFSEYTNGSHLPANIPAYSEAGNSTPYNYKYALLDPATLGVGNTCIGPIVCDDKTLTCKVATPQTQSFQPYA